MRCHASRIWSLLLSGILLAGCHPGDSHGLGAKCNVASPCRAPLVCVAGTCDLPDGVVDSGSETASDIHADSPGDAAMETNQDTASDEARQDAIGDTTDAPGAVDQPSLMPIASGPSGGSVRRADYK